MESKAWYKSKSIWTGIVTIIISGYLTAVPIFHLPAIPEYVFAILGAFGIYSRVVTNTAIKG